MAAPAPSAPSMSAAEGDPLLVQASRFGMLTGLASHLKENAAQSFREAKPWGELIDRTSFGRPGSTVEAVSRFRKNLSYFRVNYCIAGVATTSLVMLLHPWSLIVLAGLGVLWFWAYILRPGPLSFNGRELSEREKFAALAGTSLVVIFLLTNVGTTLFYALGLSALLVGLHGTLYVPDDLFLDEVPDTQGGGLLSFLTGGSQRPATVVTAV